MFGVSERERIRSANRYLAEPLRPLRKPAVFGLTALEEAMVLFAVSTERRERERGKAVTCSLSAYPDFVSF
jgi:hypothetical protein